MLAELDTAGYSAIRVAGVARRAGLTSGAIYGTFATKHDLVVAALRERCAAAIPAPAPRRDERQRPDPLLVAALEILDAKGYRATRVSDVAKRTGTTVSEIEATYPTKHHLLFAAIVARDPDAFRPALERASASAAVTGDEATTTERLLGATVAVLDTRGYGHTTVAEIARRAGLTTGAIYANYGSKQALLNAALAHRAEGAFRSALEAAEAAFTTGRPEHLLGELLTQTTSHHQAAALLQLFAAAGRADSVPPDVADLLADRREALAALLDAAKQAGQVRSDISAGALAYVVQLLMLGNMVGEAIGLPRPDSAALVETLGHLGQGVRHDASR